MKKSLVIFAAQIVIYLLLPQPTHAYTTNMDASVVVGQQDFTHTTSNQGGSVAQNALRNPWAVTSDGEKLIIAEYSNNRVLIYNNIPTANNAPADVVIGQPDFNSSLANQGGTPDANTLYRPWGLTIAGEN